MLAPMSASHWERASRFVNVYTIIQVFGSWLGAAGAMSYLFSLYGPVRAQGWAAVALAGIGLACVIVLCLSLFVLGLAALRASRRRALPGNTSTPAPNKGQDRELSSLTKPELLDIVIGFRVSLLSFQMSESYTLRAETLKLDTSRMRLLAPAGNGTMEKQEIEEEVRRLEDEKSIVIQNGLRRRLALFNRDFARRAIQLKVELSKRTGRPIDGSDDHTTALLNEHQIDEGAILRLCDFLKGMADLLSA